jgi:type IV pilus assembly protein PilE
MRNSSQQGFTLIELMIAVAVAAILTVIALPSYQAYVRRGHRAAAQSYLMDAASRQQQRFVDVRSYADAVTLNFPAPAEMAERYSIAVAAVAGPPASFTITATPQGAQVGDPCGAMSINNSNNKTAATGGCW